MVRGPIKTDNWNIGPGQQHKKFIWKGACCPMFPKKILQGRKKYQRERNDSAVKETNRKKSMGPGQ
jgi:hypothetical protein